MSQNQTAIASRQHRIELQLQQLISRVQQHLALPLNLLNGRAGQLLFLYQAAKWQPRWVSESYLSTEIDRLHEASANLVTDPTLSTGLPGVAWFYQYILQDQQVLEDCNQNTDSCLIQMLQQGMTETEYVLGLAGMAPYIGRRLAYNSQLAQVFLQQMALRSVCIQPGLRCWPVPSQSVFRLNKNQPDLPEYNLGFAHGQAGMIAALLPLLDLPATASQAATLIGEGCNWLLAQQQDANIHGSYFAHLAGVAGVSRLAWCYGDLAIALLLARVANKLAKPEYAQAARQFGCHAAKRTVAQAMITDPWICHGAGGLALMFRLLYRQLPQPEFLAAADSWLDQLLGQLAGQAYPEQPTDPTATGLISGAAGAGLCLLDALDQAPDWVDALLLG